MIFRKRCMDLVSFETQQEYDWVKGFINGESQIVQSKLKITNDQLSQATFLTSGPLAVSVTLTAAIVPTSSQRTSTVGSGRQTRLASVQPMDPLSTTGPALEASAHRGLSLTTENRSSRSVFIFLMWTILNLNYSFQNGESESCMAVLNNFYGDGIKWHDIGCHHEKPIICEDVEGHLQFARQTFPNIRIPWGDQQPPI